MPSVIFISFVTITLLITPIFERKNGAFIKINNFLKQEESSIDVIFIGSSITECSIDIKLLEENTGYQAYNLGIKGQPAAFLPLDLKQVLKKQKPEVVVVETYRYIISGPMSVDTASNALGHVGSFAERIETIGRIEMTTSNWDKLELVFPILAAHNRWSQLTTEDYFFDFHAGELDEMKGYEPHISGTCQDAYVQWNEEVIPISDCAKKDVDNLINIANKYGITLIFVDYPNVGYSEEDIKKVNGVNQYLKENGIEYVECHLDNEFINTIDPETDYFDEHHLNSMGANKMTLYVSEYLNYR